MKDLRDRIDKAEKDRMHKYYGEVAELRDWATSVKKKINDNDKMAEAVGHYFQSEHQVYTMNLISSTLSKCLNGRELNNFIDVAKERQDLQGQKKLKMMENTFA